MTTYTVRFTETAVVTTFGRMTRLGRTNRGSASCALRPARHQVRPAHGSSSRPETLQTRDDKQVVVTAYLTFRVSNPKFYQRLSGSGDHAETTTARPRTSSAPSSATP